MGLNGTEIKVAVASDFLTAFSRIPRKQQAKVLDFVNKFRTNPTLPGINYEKIEKWKDPKLRSVRIDQAYRGVVLKPEVGNVYVLLWVDHHDKAYQWAQNKVYHIHPETGSLQVVDVEEAQIEEKTQAADAEIEEQGLFAGVRDRHLLKLGVPEILLPVVRRIKTEEDLDRVADKFPQEASEALYLLAADYSVEETLRELEKSEVPATIDTDDFEKALENADSKRRFFVVDDELELAA
ncbi:MAG: hypothetical protein WCA08_22875, partial [Desulfoferrobacter sp.]